MSLPVQTKSKLKAGEILTLQVEELSPKAQGIAMVGGQSVFVKEGLPGDQVQAQLTRVRPNQIEAKLLKVESAAPERVTPLCQHFGPCGGCDLQ
ncbi:MAG: TRAM domain-containing protein, partial [Candidatus Omnitrophica bacterium]|nr:TRAM domain-containing protein [Candidatus Omnitrophota bacterium]